MQFDSRRRHTQGLLATLLRCNGNLTVGTVDTHLLEEQRNLVHLLLRACAQGEVVEGVVVAADNLLLACLAANGIVGDAEAHHVHAHIGGRLVGIVPVDTREEGVEDRENLDVAVVVDGGLSVGFEVEGVDHVHIVEVSRCRLISDVHGVLERQVPDGEGLELRIACFVSACMLVVELGETDCHLAAARSGGGNHHERARGLHEIVLAVALLRVDELHIVRVALDGVVVVGGDTQALQALAVGVGGFLPIVVGDDH